jgi:mannose-1-phosphate guanylyltransferase/phosphomannomutase
MKAVIMAGGEGTRLRPLTCDIPKPMVNFFVKPLVQYTIEHLKDYGFENMIFTLMYKPEKIMDFFEDGAAFGVHIEYAVEPSPLGTAGSVKNALPSVDSTFIVISGDALTDINLKRAIDFHKQSKAQATLVLKKMENPLEYGIVITDEHNSIIKFLEKPGWREVFSDAVNTGIYILEPEVLDLIPDNKNYDFSKNLFPDMLQRGLKLGGFLADEYWCDVGNIESYIKAHEDVLKGSCHVKLNGNNLNAIWVGKNVKISNSALLQAPSYIGDGVVIKDGAKVGMYSCISKNAEIGEYSNIKRGIIWQGSKLAKYVKLSSAVVCDNSFVGPRSNIYENAVVGRGCILDGQNTLAPRTKIWPSKWLENGANASENIIWGFGQRKGLFSFRGITGELNGALNAENITAAGCAYAAALGKDGRIVIAHDGGVVSECVYQAFAAGLKLSGCKVYEMSESLLPVERFYMKISGVEDGAYIRSLSGQKIGIELLQTKTVYAGKAKRKKAQTAFEYCDFLRPSRDAILKPNVITGLDQLYINDLSHQTSLTGRKPMVLLFAGDKKIDKLFINCLKECGLLYAYIEGQNNFCEQIASYNADIGIKLHQNGETAYYYTHKQVFDTADAYTSLVYLYIIMEMKPKELKILPGLPNTVKQIAARYGIEAMECAAEDMYQCNGEEINRLLYDPIYFAIKFIVWMQNEGLSADELVRDLPRSYIFEKEIGCDWKDIGKAIRLMYEANKDALAVEGLKVTSEKGWGFILPKEDEPKITIRAEGVSEEYSKELCDFYTQEIRRFIKS